MLTLTAGAQKALDRFVAGAETPVAGLRISVTGGGCSGTQYGMALEEAAISDVQMRLRKVGLGLTGGSRNMWDYSDKVKGHFCASRNADAVTDANAVGDVGLRSCGDALRLTLKVDPEADTILDAESQAFGCESAVASSSVPPPACSADLWGWLQIDQRAGVTKASNPPSWARFCRAHFLPLSLYVLPMGEPAVYDRLTMAFESLGMWTSILTGLTRISRCRPLELRHTIFGDANHGSGGATDESQRRMGAAREPRWYRPRSTQTAERAASTDTLRPSN